jgi:hypothetical protein
MTGSLLSGAVDPRAGIGGREKRKSFTDDL